MCRIAGRRADVPACELFTVDRKSEKNVARRTASRRIPGVDVNRSAADDRTRAVDGAAAPFNPVHRFERPDRVEIPEDAATLNRRPLGTSSIFLSVPIS